MNWWKKETIDPSKQVCPICRIDTKKLDNGDFECPGCGRHWYRTGNEEAPLASRPRKVRLTKAPEKGDHINDVIKPEE